MAKWRGKNPENLEKHGKIRKRSIKKSHVEQLEKFEKSEDDWDTSKEGFAARVVEVHKRYAFVSTEPVKGEVNTRDVWLATVARKFLQSERVERNFVAVGDRVLCTPAENAPDSSEDLPRCVIQSLAPRSACLSRLDPHIPDLRHVIAANTEQLLVVGSLLKPKIKWGLIDRYLVLAEFEGIVPVVVLNKYDLVMSEGTAELKQEVDSMVSLYRSIGYTVVTTTATQDNAIESDGIVQIMKLLEGKITLLSGHSGVGKSTLINLFDPEIVQDVEPNDDIFYKGRHTTSYASFIKLGSGGYAIDTPGIRSFTFPALSSIDLSHCFIEMRPFLGGCKYRECRHLEEPDCVIRQAVEDGKISKWRYRSYQGILLGASGREGRIRDFLEPKE